MSLSFNKIHKTYIFWGENYHDFLYLLLNVFLGEIKFSNFLYKK